MGHRQLRRVDCDDGEHRQLFLLRAKTVTFDSDNLQHPYAPPLSDALDPQLANGLRQKQSGIGIASFVLAIASGVTAAALVVIAGVMEVSTPGGMDEESPQAIIIGLGIFGVIGLNMLGIGLGVAGFFQPDRSRIFSVLGLVFNLMVILGLGGLMVIGLMIS
jgi:hypothetical protein